MKKNPIRIEGKFVVVEEVKPIYFEKIIEWRNNPENNKFLNQPYKLTMELQQKWYEKYLEDDTQGLLVLIDKKSSIPFATLGWTDYSKVEKVCISGRVLVGNKKYAGRKEFLEGTILYNDFMFQKLNTEYTYAHIVNENKDSISWSKKWGYKENRGEIKYPNELYVNDMNQTEYIRNYKDYAEARKLAIEILNLFK